MHFKICIWPCFSMLSATLLKQTYDPFLHCDPSVENHWYKALVWEKCSLPLLKSNEGQINKMFLCSSLKQGCFIKTGMCHMPLPSTGKQEEEQYQIASYTVFLEGMKTFLPDVCTQNKTLWNNKQLNTIADTLKTKVESYLWLNWSFFFIILQAFITN